MEGNIIKILPYQYVHVMDGNTNVTRLEVGPKTFILQDHEKIKTKKAIDMVSLEPYTSCRIKNPVIRGEDDEPVLDKNGQVKNHLGDAEYRTWQGYPEPFPLYPREELISIDDIVTIPKDNAARLVAERDFDDNGTLRKAGDEWLVFGPMVLMPRIEVAHAETISPELVNSNQALRVKAKRACTDAKGVKRQDGE